MKRIIRESKVEWNDLTISPEEDLPKIGETVLAVFRLHCGKINTYSCKRMLIGRVRKDGTRKCVWRTESHFNIEGELLAWCYYPEYKPLPQFKSGLLYSDQEVLESAT